MATTARGRDPWGRRRSKANFARLDDAPAAVPRCEMGARLCALSASSERRVGVGFQRRDTVRRGSGRCASERRPARTGLTCPNVAEMIADAMNDSAVIKVDIGDGRVIAVEASSTDPERPVGIGQKLSFDGVTESIEAIAQRLTDVIDRAAPQRAEVEFGVDVGVETTGLVGILAKGTGSATLKIKLAWERGGK
jgi:hypothetical protein